MIGKTLFDINYSNLFFFFLRGRGGGISPPKAKEGKAKIDKWSLIKFRSFYTARKPSKTSNVFSSLYSLASFIVD